MQPLILRELDEDDEKSFFAGLQEWEGLSSHWHTFIWTSGMPYVDLLNKLKDDAKGINLENGRVPHTMFYGFVDGVIVGRVSVRHQLNQRLLHRGGHFGYAVAPRFRQRGYATEMVRQALLFIREKLRLPELLVTCDEENTASRKIIEKFGGKFEGKFFDNTDNKWILRYWIKL
ncbi:MAG TPA: GNAT family N-acetyltransferase [Opitutales bacterium]|jgi:predicted acetyltransferase|nr:GNAT family N-acetyltransferase [Opitutales bacterium]